MAIFDFRPTTEIAIMGCIGDGRTHDWLGFVMRDAPDQPWYFRYRFRYYDGEDVSDPDADDTKNVFEFRAKASEPPAQIRDALVVALRQMLAMMKSAGFGEDVEILDVNGGPDVFHEKILASHSKFFHSWSAPAPGPVGPSKFTV